MNQKQSNFCADNASRVSRADKVLFTIFAYLAIYRLDELGFHAFRNYVISQDPAKMIAFTTYLFNTVCKYYLAVISFIQLDLFIGEFMVISPCCLDESL